jgi:hypothetical protein
MKQFRIWAFCSTSMLAIGVHNMEGQANAAPWQGSAPAAVNGRAHANSAHRSAPISQNIARGPANFGPRTINSYPAQIAGQRTVNFRPNYSQFMRPLNPTLAEMSARQTARIDNAQSIPGILARRDNEQTALPMANAQPVVKTDNLKPIRGDLARREISEGLETIDTQGIARNNNVQPIARESANRETKQRMAKWNQQTGRNRFSYSDALRRNRHEWHNRNWWRQHCNTIVFVSGGYYFLDGSYWYPAFGYDPLYNYYDYDGPIYTYGNLLPDQVIANVQVALQDAGYYFGEITGSLSVETRAALANFQRDQGLLITGAIDEPTIESLGLY